MANTTSTITREEALKKVADVLEEALNEYDLLSKMDFEMVEDPTRPSEKEEDDKDKDPKEVEKADDVASENPFASEDKKDDEKEEDEEEDKDKKEDEEDSDETLKSEFAALTEKMKARGLMKSEPTTASTEVVAAPKTETIAKSESQAAEAPKAEAAKEDKTEALAKSFDGRFENLTKTVSELSEVIKKISSAPAPRRGLNGYSPLRKSEDAGSDLSKAQVVDKLLDLQKSGNRQVDPSLINRVETGKVTNADLEFINRFVG